MLMDLRPDTLCLPVSDTAAADDSCLNILKYGLLVAVAVEGAPLLRPRPKIPDIPATSLILTLRFSFSSALSSSIMRS